MSKHKQDLAAIPSSGIPAPKARAKDLVAKLLVGRQAGLTMLGWAMELMRQSMQASCRFT
jgi:hypothetical protein